METNNDSDKVAFNLGWDFAVYGIRPNPDAPPSMLEGYRYGVASKSRKVADIFTRKLLYIRFSALMRNRVFSDLVTPALLAYLSTDTCPITRKPLTVRTQTDTDWSIDRVNNNGAYAPGNIAVMSVLANRAKGSKCAHEITNIVYGMEDTGEREHEGLNLFEWRRLSWLAQKCDRDEDVPCVMTPPPLILMSICDFIQVFLGVCVIHGRLNRVKRTLTKERAKTLTKYAKALSNAYQYRSHVSIPAICDCYHVKSVYGHFMDFYTSLGTPTPSLHGLLAYMDRNSDEFFSRPFSEYVLLKDAVRKLWRLDTHGFIDANSPDLTAEELLVEHYLDERIARSGILEAPREAYNPFI